MKKLLAALLALTLCVVLWVPTASAVNGTAAISASPASVDPGANFTVTVKVSGASLAVLYGTVTYDSNVVEFVSGDGAAGASGSVTIAKWNTNGTGSSSVDCTMTFTAKAAGSSSLTFQPGLMKTESGETVNVGNASTTVTVKATAELSGNANLASLKASSGTLSPAFSPNTTSYTVTVPNAVDRVYISAKAQESGAKVADSGSGAQTLPVGTTTRVITVTAPNGATKKYTVKITRQAADGETVSQPPASSEEALPVRPEVTVSVDGKTMTVVENLTGIEIPAGFAADVLTINDNSVVCVRNAAKVPLLYLSDGESAGFYVYDSETITFTPLETISMNGVSYLALEKPRNVSLPQGFVAREVTLGEKTLSGWRSQTDKDYYLLYLCGPGTYKGFYLYDSAEGTLQRYAALSDKAASTSAKDKETLAGPAAFAAQYWLPLAIGAGVIVFGLALALILVAAHKKKGARPQTAEEGEDEFDLDGMTFDFEVEAPQASAPVEENEGSAEPSKDHPEE